MKEKRSRNTYRSYSNCNYTHIPDLEADVGAGGGSSPRALSNNGVIVFFDTGLNFSMARRIASNPTCFITGRMQSWAGFRTSADRSSTLAYSMGRHADSSSFGRVPLASGRTSVNQVQISCLTNGLP